MAAGSTAYSPFSVSRKEQAVTLTRKTDEPGDEPGEKPEASPFTSNLLLFLTPSWGITRHKKRGRQSDFSGRRLRFSQNADLLDSPQTLKNSKRLTCLTS